VFNYNYNEKAFHNPEAEEVILSAIMYDKSYYLDLLKDEDIYTDSYKKILGIMRRLQKKGIPVDMASIMMETPSELRPQLNPVTMRIADLYRQSYKFDAYLEMLKECTARREMRDLVFVIQDELQKDQSVINAKANILEQLADIQVGNQGKDSSIKQIMLDTILDIEKQSKDKDSPHRYTGISDIDRATGGLHNGEVTVLAARPSVGKTALGVQIAMHIARRGGKLAIFSREMTGTQLGKRMVAHEGLVDGQRIRTGNIKDDDWDKIMEASAEISRWHMWVDDRSATVAEIRATCRELKQKHGLDVIVIDYLQLIAPGKRSDNREREVAEMSRGIKVLALELDIPIILLSQLNRSVANKRPTLATLRESGAIEQDADNVMFLHKPDFADTMEHDLELRKVIEQEGKVYMEIILEKQRNGRTGVFSIVYNPPYLRFENIWRGDDIG
jgi:replicative DNA helicase